MRYKYLIALPAIAISLASCSSMPNMTHDNRPNTMSVDEKLASTTLRADINHDYKAGMIDFKTVPTKSLDQIMAKNITKPAKETAKSDEDRLRTPAMQETALSYGARAGLAHETSLINQRLQANAALMTKAYDFQSLMIQGPNNTMVSPPVISSAVDAWESFDAGKTLRVADTVYEIIEQARFAPVAPIWQTYLITSFDEAQDPPAALLPQTQSEKEQWNSWIKTGWETGREQANEIFQANLDRLNRDFTGMVRYRELLEEKKVSAPILAVGNLGTTGTGQDMRVNDQAIRMTAEPTLQIKPTGWQASATTTSESGEVKGPVIKKPTTSSSKVRKKVSKKITTKSSSASNVSTFESTDGGDGRF